MHFYEVEGILVRRWVPARRRLAMEVWKGDGWAPYRDVDNVLRRGRRLTDAEALSLLRDTRLRVGTFASFSHAEADLALRDRLRRA